MNVAGSAVTPAGNPLTDTAMLPVNPLIDLAETVTVWLLPTPTLTLEGEAEMEKSAAGGGGAEFDPPHPASMNDRKPRAEKHSPRMIFQHRASAMGHPILDTTSSNQTACIPPERWFCNGP